MKTTSLLSTDSLVPGGPRYRKGDRIGGRYLVHQALAGGMGEVYLCLDLQNKLPFALKTFQARFLTSPQARAYFEREAAIWVKLENHPNVVRCFYMKPIEETPFLFLEWVEDEGGESTDLRGWLVRRSPLEPRLALEFVLDICRALAHADRKAPGFVHLDIKPENVLVTQGRIAKLTDFGLAKVVREAGLAPPDEASSSAGGRWQITSAGGTPPYMAPEQWRGMKVDARTDVYAVGCLLYELLAGHRPFRAGTLDGLRHAHLETTPPSLGAIVKESPGERLDALVARCLAKPPEDRYASASELSKALADLYVEWHGAPPRGVPEAAGLTASDYSNRGNTYDALGLSVEALADLAQAIRFDPLFAPAYFNRGNTYRNLGRFEEALADYDAAIRIDRKLAAAFCNRGATYDALGRHTEALADYAEAIRLDPNNAQAYYNRGLTYNAMDRHAEALAEYAEAIRIDPLYALAYLNRGNTYNTLGRHSEALADYAEAIRLDPDNAQAYCNRGLTYNLMGRHTEALAEFAGAIRLDPNDAQTCSICASTYMELGQHADALKLYERVLALLKGKFGPDHPNTLRCAYNIACCQALLVPESTDPGKRADLAMESLQKAIAAGYRNVAQIKMDSDLDALRNREDFANLLAELEREAAEKE
ncbi:MAG TPA: serine/threonine-protein kinase [Pirellulales bacterium]|nr:serine/threonine-protein kinase [Pirellulales bacterium]